MDEIQKMLTTTVVSDSKGGSLITVAHVASVAVGALGLYLMIPERKRKMLFK